MTLSEKYPERYFDHWLAMLCANYDEVSESEIVEHADSYKSIEGRQAFSALQAEVETIVNNDDLIQFVAVAKDYGLEKITLHHLTNMVEIIHRKY